MLDFIPLFCILFSYSVSLLVGKKRLVFVPGIDYVCERHGSVLFFELMFVLSVRTCQVDRSLLRSLFVHFIFPHFPLMFT